ncbi:hypothetical protein DFH07DRAFT_784669 [Mycena maculata]|uniref:Uncharacterized protein n=1 Tax=Mycena maculata TaxID=230809 RepID=A0AAD7HF87_9AGAR|nr:hypothetical protein DFH07DRAFT_784669 [Mycena maculata]
MRRSSRSNGAMTSPKPQFFRDRETLALATRHVVEQRQKLAPAPRATARSSSAPVEDPASTPATNASLPTVPEVEGTIQQTLAAVTNEQPAADNAENAPNTTAPAHTATSDTAASPDSTVDEISTSDTTAPATVPTSSDAPADTAAALANPAATTPAVETTTAAAAPTYASVTAAACTEDFPPLPDYAPPVASHAAKRKNKGKGKAPAPPAPASADDAAHTIDVDAPDILGNFFANGACINPPDVETLGLDEAADIARAKALSLAQQHIHHPDSTTPGASSSRRGAPDQTPASPPKRQRADTAGHAIATGGTDAAPPVARNSGPAAGPAPHVRQRGVNYHTIDGNPPHGSFTPVPAGGFRPSYGMTASTLYRNVPAQQMQQWENVAHPKFIAVTAQRISAQIAGRFNMDTSVPRVGPPGLAEGPGHDPIAWLIGGLAFDQAQALLDDGVLAADGHATLFFPYVPYISGFLGTFQGLTLTDSDHDGDLAAAIISDAITSDPAILRHVRAHRDAFPPEMTVDEAFARFTESIYVRPLALLSPQGPFTAWNAYCSPPTDDENTFETLRRLVGNLVINTPFNGQGRIYRALLCHICLATDHPTNVCPLPSAPGWMGPTAETIGALEAASRDALSGGKKTGRGDRDKGGKDAKGKGKRKGNDHDGRNGGYGRN